MGAATAGLRCNGNGIAFPHLFNDSDAVIVVIIFPEATKIVIVLSPPQRRATALFFRVLLPHFQPGGAKANL
jgi:hypothetical protein